MGLLKFAVKATGTVLLTATGVTSHVLSVAVGAAGSSSTFFDSLEQASFDKVRDIWNSGKYEETEDGISEDLSLENTIKNKESSLRLAETSKMKIEDMLRKMEQNLSEAIAEGKEVNQNEIKGKCKELQEKYNKLERNCEKLKKEIQLLREKQQNIT